MPDKIVNHFVLADGSTAKYDAGYLANLDETISLAGYAPDAKVVGNRLEYVDDSVNRSFEISTKDSYNPQNIVFTNGDINNSTGKVSNLTENKKLITELLGVQQFCSIDCTITDQSNITDLMFYLYDISGTFMQFVIVPVTSGVSNYKILTKNANNFRLKVSYNIDVTPSTIVGNINIKFSIVAKHVTYTTGKNLFDKNDPYCVNGFYLSNYNGKLQPSGSYGVSGFIPVKTGETICISPSQRQFLQYDEMLNPIISTFNGNSQNNFVYTPQADGFIRFTYFASNVNSQQVEVGNTPTNYEAFQYIAENGINFVNDTTSQHIDAKINNVLYGKKWAVCGDSFTAGVLSTTIGVGKYSAEKVVYPYLIGNKNNMDILSYFAQGRTLAYPSDGTFSNSLTNPSASFYYQNIPSDVDYITIYLGINDSHHETGAGGDGEDPTGIIPLGTIDDNTTATYYGALNVVLQWLITNRPFAHIGMIISNGCDRTEYRTAQIEVSEKFGIPYIDLNGDSRTPIMIRSQNPNIPSGVKWLVNNKQAVSYPSNTHPNDNAHVYESTFIENFLRSL